MQLTKMLSQFNKTFSQSVIFSYVMILIILFTPLFYIIHDERLILLRKNYSKELNFFFNTIVSVVLGDDYVEEEVNDGKKNKVVLLRNDIEPFKRNDEPELGIYTSPPKGFEIVSFLEKEEYINAVSGAISHAEKEILISMYQCKIKYDAPEFKRLRLELFKAKNRGVKIIFFLDAKLDANYETDKFLSEKGILCILVSLRTHHEKMIVVDSKMVFISSANLTYTGAFLNKEISVSFENVRLGSQIRKYLLQYQSK